MTDAAVILDNRKRLLISPKNKQDFINHTTKEIEKKIKAVMICFQICIFVLGDTPSNRYAPTSRAL